MTLKADVRLYDDKTGEIQKELKYTSMEDNCEINSSGILFSGEVNANFDVMGGKPLLAAEISNLTVLTNILSEFYDVNAAAIVKNSTPCAVALGSGIEEAYEKVADSDPITLISGSIGFSKKVDYTLALKLSALTLDLIVAPDYDEKALSLLNTKTDATIIKVITPLKDFKNFTQTKISTTPFGVIYKQFEKVHLSKESFNIVTKTKPTAEQIEDVVFAWNISKYTAANSVVVAKDFKTSAIVQGFTSSVNAVEYALDCACENSKDAILVTDVSLDMPEAIFAAAQGRVSVIIQPGGSLRDNRLIDLANKYNIAMIFTGIENYKY